MEKSFHGQTLSPQPQTCQECGATPCICGHREGRELHPGPGLNLFDFIYVFKSAILSAVLPVTRFARIPLCSLPGWSGHGCASAWWVDLQGEQRTEQTLDSVFSTQFSGKQYSVLSLRYSVHPTQYSVFSIHIVCTLALIGPYNFDVFVVVLF